MSLARLVGRVYDGLASLRLAVVVMLGLGFICLLATLYESNRGTGVVQREVYRTGWFASILALLGLNILCSMVKRYPWRAHHTGFVMAHAGILTVLVGSLVSLHFGMDGNMALYVGETTQRVALLHRSLQVIAPGHAPGVFPVAFEQRPPRPGHEERFPLPGGDLTLVAEDYLPHVEVKEEYVRSPDGPPALHLVLEHSLMKRSVWLSTVDPSAASINFGPVVVSLRTLASDAEMRGPASPSDRDEIAFLLTPSGVLAYVINTHSGPGPRGAVALRQELETPWGMHVRVDRFFPHASYHDVISPASLPERDDLQQPAVKVHLQQSAWQFPSIWVPWTEARALPLGGSEARIAFRAPEVSVPFRVTLLNCNSDKYPGSSTAATYESWVRVDDPGRGVSDHHISMNHPLHYRGYIFFQASFVEGQPMMSIFSVATSPGLPLVYLGTILIVGGVFWMFYLKPYFATAAGRRALLAHRAQESPQ